MPNPQNKSITTAPLTFPYIVNGKVNAIHRHSEKTLIEMDPIGSLMFKLAF